MAMNTKSLYTLSKFALVEMVRDFYRDDKERTKYLNSRTKQQLINMMEERLTYQAPPPPPPPPPVPTFPTYPTPYNSPTHSDAFLQSKYSSFLKRLHETEEENEKSKLS
jgi:hypothetical protein